VTGKKEKDYLQFFNNHFKGLEERIGFVFEDKSLLIQAFSHRSYLNENPNFSLDNNERLEFLGDAVLELVVTEYLFNNFDNSEGELTNWRAALVNSQSLSESAQALNFNNYILLSRGESKDIGKARQCILANCLEAFLGAFYLDQGFAAAQVFIKREIIDKKLKYIIKNGLFHDDKSLFQEMAQKYVAITPDYKVIKEEGPDHAKEFTIAVFLDKEMVAQGKGSSKQLAEEEAAKHALGAKGWNL
jgi:ribonuclease III